MHTFQYLQKNSSICVVCDEQKIDHRGCCGTPDIVVEILSSGNSKKELQNKFDLYEEYGILEYWVVVPAEKFIVIWYLEDGKYRLGKPFSPGQVITSSILPNFRLDTSNIFK